MTTQVKQNEVLDKLNAVPYWNPEEKRGFLNGVWRLTGLPAGIEGLRMGMTDSVEATDKRVIFIAKLFIDLGESLGLGASEVPLFNEEVSPQVLLNHAYRFLGERLVRYKTTPVPSGACYYDFLLDVRGINFPLSQTTQVKI